MAAEVDRLQAALHADALRICAAAELRALGVYTDQYLRERDGLIVVGICWFHDRWWRRGRVAFGQLADVNRLTRQEDGVPALQRSIQVAWRRRLGCDVLHQRHCAEAAALQASQVPPVSHTFSLALASACLCMFLSACLSI